MCERKRDFLRVFIMLHAILWCRVVKCGLCVNASLDRGDNAIFENIIKGASYLSPQQTRGNELNCFPMYMFSIIVFINYIDPLVDALIRGIVMKMGCHL